MTASILRDKMNKTLPMGRGIQTSRTNICFTAFMYMFITFIFVNMFLVNFPSWKIRWCEKNAFKIIFYSFNRNGNGEIAIRPLSSIAKWRVYVWKLKKKINRKRKIVINQGLISMRGRIHSNLLFPLLFFSFENKSRKCTSKESSGR